MSNNGFDPSLPPLPLINDPIMAALKGDDNNANAKVQAQIDALRKENAKLDEKLADMQHKQQFDQALGAINNQLVAMGKQPVSAQNPFSNTMPALSQAGAAVSSPALNTSRNTAPSLAAVGGGGGVRKV